MTKEKRCAKHNVPFVLEADVYFCPVCDKIKSIRMRAATFRKETNSQFRKRNKMLKEYKEERKKELDKIMKGVAYCTAHATEIYNNKQRELEEMAR